MIINVILFVLLIQGDQRSPGIIPLAVKDAFSIIQEVLFKQCYFLVTFLSREVTHYGFCLFQTPNREFLLRVSYLEIYNEVTFFAFSYPSGLL